MIIIIIVYISEMSIFHEHPIEINPMLSLSCIIRLVFKNVDTGITASTYVKLGSFIHDKMDEPLTKADYESMLVSMHFLCAPRDYMIVKIRETYYKDFLCDAKWEPLTGSWFIYRGIIGLLPCSWRGTQGNIKLVKYEISEWNSVD